MADRPISGRAERVAADIETTRDSRGSLDVLMQGAHAAHSLADTLADERAGQGIHIASLAITSPQDTAHRALDFLRFAS